jgi:hypothetical protein
MILSWMDVGCPAFVFHYLVELREKLHRLQAGNARVVPERFQYGVP